MDAAQEARAAKINAALWKRGADEVTGAARAALLTELSGILNGPERQVVPLDPARQARLEDINRRLRENALATDPRQRMTVIESNDLAREAADILGGDDAIGGEAA